MLSKCGDGMSHRAVLSMNILCQLRGVVLGVVTSLCVPSSSLPHIMQGIPLDNRHKLALPRHAIILYLLVAPICTYLRTVLVWVLEEGSHHYKMHPK